MQEIRCLHCGAVFFASSSGALCPYCGRIAQPPARKFWSSISRYVAVAISIVIAVLFEHPGLIDRQSITFIVVLGGCGLAWAFWQESGHKQRSREFSSLNLAGKGIRDSAAGSVPTTPSPPQVPPEWRSLAALARPREVYLPTSAKMSFIGTALLVAAGLVFLVYAGRHYPPFKTGRTSSTYRTIFLVGLILPIWGLFERVRQELSGRALLRDGEVTIGYIADWIAKGHYGAKVTYQFWTTTGKRFEHERPVVSDKDVFSEKALVPIFYMPEDPTKSTALCCVNSRVRIPGEKFMHAAKTVPRKLSGWRLG